VNCEKGPTADPCNKCASCREIAQGNSFDILEIDGASNRGIDEIRNLRENVKFAPSKGRYKIYIIDEVHMLTEAAFNALLKTLEEPPPHVVFIFATTQGYKVPSTILSRCQRFDFRRIPSSVIMDNLKSIAKDEKLSADDGALAMIARYSEGSLRDAQVMLDQAAAFGSGKVGMDGVASILGCLSDDANFEIADAIRKKDAQLAVGLIGRFIDEGKDPFQIAQSLVAHFRNMAVAKISASPAGLIEASAETVERYRKASSDLTVEEILYYIYSFSSAIDTMRRSGLGRIPFEAAVIKLARHGRVAPIADIVERLERLAVSRESGVRSREFGAAAPRSAVDRDEISRQLSAASEREARIQQPAADKQEVRQNMPDTGPKTAQEPQAASADLDEVLAAWSGIVKYVIGKKTFIGYYLQEGFPSGFEGKTVTISFPKESRFHKEELEKNGNKALIEEAIRSALRLELKVSFAISAEPSAPNGPRGRIYPEEESPRPEADEYGVKDMDPIVKTAMEMFGGEVARKPVKKQG
jgi:DNA polymerase-3 subunit gamma/tau